MKKKKTKKKITKTKVKSEHSRAYKLAMSHLIIANQLLHKTSYQIQAAYRTISRIEERV